jgi:hypothetical protein
MPARLRLERAEARLREKRGELQDAIAELGAAVSSHVKTRSGPHKRRIAALSATEHIRDRGLRLCVPSQRGQ